MYWSDKVSKTYFDIILDTHLYMSVNNKDYYNSFEQERVEVVKLLEQYNDKVLDRKDMINLAKSISNINDNKNVNPYEKDQFKDLLEYYFIPFEWRKYQVNGNDRWGLVIRLNAFDDIYELILKLRSRHCKYYSDYYDKLNSNHIKEHNEPLNYEKFKNHVIYERKDFNQNFRATTRTIRNKVYNCSMRFKFTYLKK